MVPEVAILIGLTDVRDGGDEMGKFWLDDLVIVFFPRFFPVLRPL